MSPTSFLVLSDTHDTWPYSPEQSAPKADVFLHCGDLTQVGGLRALKRAISHIKSINAELKIVIAGNHDLELDEKWVRENAEDADLNEDLKDSRVCVDFMKGLKADGIFYVEEGTHTFTLKSGQSFTLYASPYTPEFNGYAFAYGSEDRFNSVSGHDLDSDGLDRAIYPRNDQTYYSHPTYELNITNPSHGRPNPIPAGIDIAITHGPPLILNDSTYLLDTNDKGEHLGCEKLAKAIERVKPRMHCFGHIHEGKGAAKVIWGGVQGEMPRLETLGAGVLRVGGRKLDTNQETLLVNAAVNKEDGNGWLVEMDL